MRYDEQEKERGIYPTSIAIDSMNANQTMNQSNQLNWLYK